MLRIRARLSLTGDPQVLLAESQKFDQRLARREVQLSVQVRAPGVGGRPIGARIERELPAIVNGKADEAYAALGRLYEQSLLTADETQEVSELIDRFAELTR